MKVKLDENLPLELVSELGARGHDVDTVRDEGLAGHPDPDVWQEAQDSGRFFVTQDLDFSDARVYAPGSHHGILLVRLAAPSRKALIARIATTFSDEDVESWAGAFVVLTDTKLRVRTSASDVAG